MQADPPTLDQLEIVFANVLTVSVTLIGIVFLVMLVVGGFQFISSSGDKESAQKARNTLTFAIAGLVLAASGWLIINLIASFFGLPNLFTTFRIAITP